MELKIFDSLLEPVFVLNAQKQIVYVNEVAANLCDQSVRKLIRSKPLFDEIFQFAAPVEFLKNISEVSDPSPYQEMSFVTLEQKTGKVQITAQKIPDHEGAAAWLVYFRDVTLEETLQKKYKAEQAELEKYSKNLEKMVAERTAQITQLNQTMSALLDSLGQGFFLFNSKGLCSDVYSKACEQTVENKPAGKMIWDVLGLKDKQVPGFQKWMTTVFSEMLPFEDLAPLGPPEFQHSQGRKIQLQYHPLRNANSQMEAVVVVSTDITELVEAQKSAAAEKSYAQMIISLVQQKRYVQSFLQESEELLKEMKLELARGQNASPESLFRYLHTLKGGAATFSIQPMVDQAHQSENLLTNWKFEPSEKAFNDLKESSLLIENKFRSFLNENESILGSAEKMKKRWVEVPADKLWNFERSLPPTFQKSFTESFLMESAGVHFHQYSEVIKNVAEREGKSLHDLKIVNGDLLVLPEVYSTLFSTFVHAFRNAVDHGIETPDIRESLGKNPSGQIQVEFKQFSDKGQDWLHIQVQDDGSGIDPAKIRARLTSKGMDVSKEDDYQVIQHVFDSQFSTKEAVTETSGRGVGMDAILHAASKLGGKAYVTSIIGKGTTLHVQVPYLVQIPTARAA